MSEKLTRFCVSDLHGSRKIDVRLEGSQLVLVGENGTGKSTFVNLIYYFLTKQWMRFREFSFARVIAEFDTEQLVMTPKDLAEYFEARQHMRTFARFTRHLSPRRSMQAIERMMELVSLDITENRGDVVERLAMELEVPRSVAIDLVREFE